MGNMISVKGITKTFGSVVANNDINFAVKSGEIHALLGENGAGKSTLINILSGVYTPDCGTIEVEGEEVKFSSPKDAKDKGVGTVYQHFKLVENMTAIENIMVGLKTKIKRSELIKKVESICNKYSIDLELDKYVEDMSVGEKQNLEIVKVLNRGARILILDEPTAVFTPKEVDKLFKIMRRLKEKNCAVIFITHKLHEVMEICDRITVLRKGETVGSVDKENTDPKQLTNMMVGKPVTLKINKVKCTMGEEVLEVKNLNVLNEEGHLAVKNLSFSVRSGEVLGIAGIAGCGQKELCEAIAGVTKIESGKIISRGEELQGKNPREFVNKGIAMSFIPEDRLGMGLVPSRDMVDNLLLKSYHTVKGLFIDRKSYSKKAIELVDKLEIKTPSINHPIRYLSGGNIQKILLGRELSLEPKVLVMAYPVRGLDINTCFTIYNIINEEKQKGTAIIFVGEDLDVLIELCDRIMVMSDGEISGILDGDKATREELGYMMVGTRLEEDIKEKEIIETKESTVGGDEIV